MAKKLKEDRPKPATVAEAYRLVAMTPPGQVMLKDLVRRFGFATVSTMEPGDPHMTAWREGQRTIVTHFHKMIEGEAGDLEDTTSDRGEW